MLAACALGPDDDLDAENDLAGDVNPENELALWTGVQAPPYDAAGLTLGRRVVELKPDASRPITLVAAMRWRQQAPGAINPQLRFGLVNPDGESTLLQVFQGKGGLRTRFDLEMTDVLQVGAWYRVVLTIGEAPGRAMQVRIFDENAAEVWRSCGGANADCASAPIDPDALDTLRLVVTIDDVQHGEGHIELKDLSLRSAP